MEAVLSTPASAGTHGTGPAPWLSRWPSPLREAPEARSHCSPLANRPVSQPLGREWPGQKRGRRARVPLPPASSITGSRESTQAEPASQTRTLSL